MARVTERAYSELQQAYDFYNAALFNGELPDCLITFQRGKNTMGYFSFRRFVATDGSKKMIDEIALNPEFFPVYPLIEVMQTLVHEQCHMWQFHFGNPSRITYHNEEWAAKMEGIGLMPSSTGAPGGSRTGQKMNDYPIAGGLFQRATLELFQGQFALTWFDRYPVKAGQQKDLSGIVGEWRETLTQAQESNETGADIESLLSMALRPSVTLSDSDTSPEQGAPAFMEKPPRSKTKYQCAGCANAVWGKPGMRISCDACKMPFTEMECQQ